MKLQNIIVGFITIFVTITVPSLVISCILVGVAYLLEVIGVPFKLCQLLSFGICISIGTSLWIALDKKSFR
jgi:hypothetical protein